MPYFKVTKTSTKVETFYVYENTPDGAWTKWDVVQVLQGRIEQVNQ